MAPNGGIQPLALAWREARVRQGQAQERAAIEGYARRFGIGFKLSSQIYRAAQEERVHPALAFSLVRVESGFDPAALGPSGSIGLTQLQPSTARHLSPSVSTPELYSTPLNLSLGFRYLRELLERFDQNVILALVAYNRGPQHVERRVASGGWPDTRYARKVLRHVERSAGQEL